MKREYIFLVLGVLVTSFIWGIFYKRLDNTNKEKIELKISEHKTELKKLKTEKDSLYKVLDSLKKIEPIIIKEYDTIQKKWDDIRNAPITDAVSDSMLRTILRKGQTRFDQ